MGSMGLEGGHNVLLQPDIMLPHPEMWRAHLTHRLQNTRDRHDRVVDFKDGKEGGEKESNNIKPAGGTDKGFF